MASNVKTNHDTFNSTSSSSNNIVYPGGDEDVDEEEIVFLERDDGHDISLLVSSRTTSTTTTPTAASETDLPSNKPTTAASSDDCNYYYNRAVVRRRQRARLFTPSRHRHVEFVSFQKQQESFALSTSWTDTDHHKEISLEDTTTQTKIKSNYELANPNLFQCFESPQNHRDQQKKKKAKESIEKPPKIHVFTPPQHKRKLKPIATVVAEKSIVGTRPSHWTSGTNIIESAKKNKQGISSKLPSMLGGNNVTDKLTTKVSPKIQHSALKLQRAALRSAAAITTTSSIKKKMKKSNTSNSNHNGSGLSGNAVNSSSSTNFYPSFLERQHEEKEFANDASNMDGDDCSKIGKMKNSIIPIVKSLHAATPSNECTPRNNAIGPIMRELYKIRSNREGKQLRLNATSYSYKCSRFMKGDPRRTHMKHHVDVTLLGSFLSDAMSQISSILGYVHEAGEVANFCFIPETIQDLKLHHGSQLRIYDCLRVHSSIMPTFICTSLAEPHPSGLPELPALDEIPLPHLSKE